MFKERQIHRNYWEWVPKEDSRVLLFDIETDGLLDATTKIHCICCKDWLTKETFSFRYDQMEEARVLLDSYDCLVAHNGLCFDAPVLEKLWNRAYRVFDTLTAARLIWTDIADHDFSLIRRRNLPVEFPKKLIGRHSLKAWGYRLGCYKGDYGETTEDAWAHWSQEMQDYCEQDVEVLEKLYATIVSKDYSPEALALEHEFQKVIFNQERMGVYFDKAKAIELYSSIASSRDSLFRELQEEFPPKKVTEVFIPKRNNSVKGYIKGVPMREYLISLSIQVPENRLQNVLSDWDGLPVFLQKQGSLLSMKISLQDSATPAVPSSSSTLNSQKSSEWSEKETKLGSSSSMEAVVFTDESSQMGLSQDDAPTTPRT